MIAATYVTIWTALALFALGEMGRARGRPSARSLSAAGLALAVIHTLLAFAVFHGWSHADAVRNTALQTGRVFGVRVGFGVYVNYAFFAVWLVDLLTWRGPASSPATSWLIRGFYLLIILNGAIVFAAGWRRLAGVAVTAALVYAWTVRSGPVTGRFASSSRA